MAILKASDGAEICYVTRGIGKPILFVHGWLGSLRVWDVQLYELQDSFHCVAFDLRGMGESGKPDCRYDFGEFADDLRVLIEELGLSEITLVGWSMGVSVSLSYMARYQQEGAVSRLVLVNGPIKLINSNDWNLGIGEDECMGYINRIVEEPINGRWDFARSNLYNPTKFETSFLFHISLQTPLDVAIKAVKNQIQLDHRPVLPNLGVPCLAIQSDHDFYPVALGEYIAGMVPNGRLLVFEDSGHSVQLQDSRRFNDALVEFIEST
jgi:pimeloyl-ACP methyl ester carboxylesterase